MREIFLQSYPNNFESQVEQLTAKVCERVELGRQWLLRNIKPNGLFQYLYMPHNDEYSTKNNAVRQLMASRILAELATHEDSFIASHEKNLKFVVKHWVRREKDICFVLFNGKSKLGANAMMLRTLVASPLKDEYADLILRMAKGILRSMNTDGSFVPFLVQPKYPYNADYMLTFYSGEAILSLMELYGLTKNRRVMDAAVNAQNFYIEKYVNQIRENYYPAYVPWHCMSLNHLFKNTGDIGFARAAFTLIDNLLEMQDLQDHVGRFYNPSTPQFGSPHTSSDGVYAEGLAYALELAFLTADAKRTQRYFHRLNLSFSYLMSLQYTDENSSHLANPGRAVGGFRIRKERADSLAKDLAGSNTRIDCAQHTIDAMHKFLQIASDCVGSME